MSTAKASWSRRLGVLLGAVSALLALVVLFAPSVFSSVLRNNGLLPHPDRYTALYFTNPGSLIPSPADRKQIVVAFTIENHEAQRQIYSYLVSVGRTNGVGAVLASGLVALAARHVASRVVRVARPMPGRLCVRISLTGVTQGISFWTSK